MVRIKNSAWGSNSRIVRRTCRANATLNLALLLLVFLTFLCSLSFGQTPSARRASTSGGAQTSTPELSSASTGSNRCIFCHPAEVEGYARSTMAHSLRRAGHEPDGTVSAHGSKITMHSSSTGYWQRWENGGETIEYRIEYVIGSGTHASGYLAYFGGHLFQSPLAFYRSRQSYDLAPGYENLRNPDFTRPVTEECVLCHSGTALFVPGTLNQYRSPVFAAEAITCERCHGPVERHLADPRAGTIVNPVNLEPAARDSICEQCHLFGAARILNPGKKFSDFVPGQRLEDTFTIYHDAVPPGSPAGAFKVISHVEQLALSACARNSSGRLWCGTCHDPHQKPLQPVEYYRARCLSCHTANLSASHPAGDSDCLSCHMPRRNAQDGGHSVFTDHRIQRAPVPQRDLPPDTGITAWREPSPDLQRRNLGIAYIDVGMQRQSPSFIMQGYRALTEVQHQFLNDSDFFKWLGDALLIGKQTKDAEAAFEKALQLDPDSPLTEASAAPPYIQAGDTGRAIAHLERAVSLDPLYLPAVRALIDLYQKQGKTAEAEGLSAKVKSAINEASASGQTAQTASADDSEKRAEDVFKNIQALQGTLAGQLIPAMEFISSSLGVECSFCHVEGHFEKDDKKPKRTARRMMHMMFALNKNNFEDRREVTCYSCHRGARDPISTPFVDNELPHASNIADSEAPNLPTNLPTISQLIENYVNALGGASCIVAITARIEKGTAVLQGRAENIEIFTQTPEKQTIVRHLSNSDSWTVFDGQSGWFAISGSPARDMLATDREAARMDADLQFPLHIRQYYRELRIEYPEIISGREAYVLYGTHEDQPATKLYFDEQSGLLLRVVRYAKSPVGLDPTEIDYADFREVDHLKVPFRVTTSQPRSTTIFQIQNVQQNVLIDNAIFGKPVSNSAPASSVPRKQSQQNHRSPE
jgi:photosynthetic reaction center cytochrome c subunit